MLLYILRLIDVFEILARNDDDGDAARDDHDGFVLALETSL